MIVVRKHKGRSGISVYEWRVYSVTSGPRVHTTQLGKYRTQEAAERAAEYHRQHAAAVAERTADYWQRWQARQAKEDYATALINTEVHQCICGPLAPSCTCGFKAEATALINTEVQS